jgi:hypothetical protein
LRRDAAGGGNGQVEQRGLSDAVLLRLGRDEDSDELKDLSIKTCYSPNKLKILYVFDLIVT